MEPAKTPTNLTIIRFQSPSTGADPLVEGPRPFNLRLMAKLAKRYFHTQLLCTHVQLNERDCIRPYKSFCIPPTCVGWSTGCMRSGAVLKIISEF